MLWVPPSARESAHNLSATPLTLPGATITASATPHAKGAWTSLIDPVPFDVHLLHLAYWNSATAATRTDQMLDIGYGPAGGGSEQVLLPEILTGWAPNGDRYGRSMVLPLFIPAGGRLSARLQALIASDTLAVFVGIAGGGDGIPGPLFRGADAFGTVVASSIGTSHTPGNTGAESAWANLGSATANDYIGCMMMVQGTMATTVMTTIGYHWELGYSSGAAPLGEWAYGGNTNEILNGPWPVLPSFKPIPSGTQLQVRAEASGTAQAYDVAALCFY